MPFIPHQQRFHQTRVGLAGPERAIVAHTFKLTIAYDGTDYVGWQIQPNGETIQSTLQRALKTITKQSVTVIGSGRTDAGVHALAQVASCTIDDWNASARDLGNALNTVLPPTVVIQSAIDAPQGFHAIRDAISKRYRYQIQIGGPHDAFEHRYRWRLRGEIDIAAMRQAAAYFEGEHDFSSFQAAGAPRQSTVRTISACEVVEQPEPPYCSSPPEANIQRIAIEVEANGFLYNMVRNIVGTLVEIGRGKQSPGWISEVIATQNRNKAGPTAPALGLFLLHVDYASFRPFDVTP